MKALLGLVLAAGLTGCFVPCPMASRVGVRGRVIDARTHQAVVDATVTVMAKPGPGPSVLGHAEPASARTGPDGAFFVPPKIQIGPYLVGSEEFAPRKDKARIEKPGYARSIRDISCPVLTGAGGATQNLGAVELQPIVR